MKTAPNTKSTSQTLSLLLHVASSPAWLHTETLAALRRQSRKQCAWTFAFSKGERAVLRSRKPIPVSEWAERHRVLHLSSRPGKWHNAVTPYTQGIMDASFFSSVQKISIMKCPQSGGTECVHNCIGYAIDRAPGPVLYVFPNQDIARENAQDRIIPMLQASPRLSEYLTGSVDDMSSLRINVAHLTIHMAWSGSAARLGNKPIRYLVLDELDKYQNSKREASSEALARKRTITWGRRSREWDISTPTMVNGPIHQCWTTAEARFRYHVICPNCGCELLMDFAHIQWPEDVDNPVSIKSRCLAWYECPHCTGQWSDVDRDRAVRAGQWREETSGLPLFDHLHQHQPMSIAFHLPAWISPFVSLSEIAEIALQCQLSTDIKLHQDLKNNYLAEPWEPEYELRSEDGILALCDDRPCGTVPGPLAGSQQPRVACLLAGVDTQGSNEQKGYFRYVIRAFGFGDTEESWLVKSGVAASFGALNEILWKSVYRDANGQEYHVRNCMIDAMGHRTKEVYSWAIRHRGRAFPWKGEKSMTQPFTPSAQEYFPDATGKKIKIPGGINLWRCDTTFFKSDLSAKLSIHPTDPGAFHLHSNALNELEQYAREMSVEVWDEEKMGWVNPHKRANHFWDCETMVLALAYILNVRHARPQNAQEKPAPQQPQVQVQVQRDSRFSGPSRFAGRGRR